MIINSQILTKYESGTLPAYLSNGVIGMRVGMIPFFKCNCCLNGFVGIDSIERVQGIEYVPYPLNVDINIDSFWMSQMEGCVKFISQYYDFSCGELTSKFEYTINAISAAITVITFCSRSIPNIVMQEVRISLNKNSKVTLKAKINASEAPVNLILRDAVTVGEKDYMDGAILFESKGGLTKAGIAFYTSMEPHEEIFRENQIRGFTNELSTIYKVGAKKNKEYLLQQIVALVPSVMHSEPDRQAIRLINLAKIRGFQTVREENKNKWNEIWKGRINIFSNDEKWQAIADAAYFYMHTSVHEASPCSTGLFGVGLGNNYHYYRGHVFWDIEVFTEPILLLTAPNTAKTILNYRKQRLEVAKKNALMSGYRGAMYPWESSIFGEEVTPTPWSDIFHEQHINMDIAFAMFQYVYATDDDIFLKDSAWPVISSIAEWIESRVVKTERGYEILHVTGIDEGASYVDNNSWTNCGAIIALDEAIKIGKRLGYSVPKVWNDIKNNIYLSIDTKSKVLQKYDGFEYKGGGCCPDSLAVLFPLNFRLSDEVEKATYECYLDKVDGYVGYPMLSSLLGVYATRIGDRKLALELLEKGVADFVVDNFMQFDEFGKNFDKGETTVGPYMANLGGYLMSCLYGLTGIKIDESDPSNWGKYPIVMPECWEGIEAEVWIKGKKAKIRAMNGDKKATITYI